jgi:Fe-S cluster assembly protein SufD
MPVVLDSYLAEAERISAEHRPTDPDWLVRVRREAAGRFETLGFPTSRDEEWRFTSVAPIAEGRFVAAHDSTASVTRADLAPFEWPGHRAATLVFVNGRYAEGLSDAGRLPPGVRVQSLARELTKPSEWLQAHFSRIAAIDRKPFTALNTAFVTDGAVVSVPESTAIEAPIHLLFLSAGESEPDQTMAHPRVLVVMGANSQATVVETYGEARAGRYLTNAVTDVVAARNATLHHYKIQRESAASFHIGAMYARAERDANLLSHSISFGGSLVRNDVNVVLDGEGAGCTLNGLYVSDGTRLVDNHTTIDHARPHCASREIYKGILAGRARAVFNGKIIVRPDAQKTDAKQTNKALLLSEDAQIHTKPELEIYANDVKCTHGAAIGQIDDEAIFYLRARGIGEREARHVLIRAFAGDVLNLMPLAPLRARIDEELVRRLPEWRA